MPVWHSRRLESWPPEEVSEKSDTWNWNLILLLNKTQNLPGHTHVIPVHSVQERRDRIGHKAATHMKSCLLCYDIQYLNYWKFLVWMKSTAHKKIRSVRFLETAGHTKLVIRVKGRQTLLIRIKQPILLALHCPFNTPPIWLFVFILRTSSINIRPCSSRAVHNQSLSMHSFTSRFKVKTLVGGAHSTKWEHSACYRTMDGAPVALSACL